MDYTLKGIALRARYAIDLRFIALLVSLGGGALAAVTLVSTAVRPPVALRALRKSAAVR